MSFKLLKIKRIYQLLNLSCSLIFHERQMAEELDHSLDLLAFDALKNTLVVYTFDHRKVAG